MSEDELFVLNRIVSAFFDIAELKARRRQHIYMRDWLAELDKFTRDYAGGALPDAGSVSHETAILKANEEYEKYKQRTIDELSPVEREYLKMIKDTQRKLEAKQPRKNAKKARGGGA
jgi:hypothetical protein